MAPSSRAVANGDGAVTAIAFIRGWVVSGLIARWQAKMILLVAC
jgi:hypothetical protein